MKKAILVLLSVLSINGFAGNGVSHVLEKEPRKGNDVHYLPLESMVQHKLLTTNFIVATTVHSAKRSAAIISKVKVIAKTGKTENPFVPAVV